MQLEYRRFQVLRESSTLIATLCSRELGSHARVARVSIAHMARSMEGHENIFKAVKKCFINQYQLSWLIFIGLVVMISACQE